MPIGSRIATDFRASLLVLLRGEYQHWHDLVSFVRYSKVLHGPMDSYVLKNDISLSTPIHLGDSLLSVRILYDFSTGLRGFSSEVIFDASRYFYMKFYEISIILSIVWISAD